MNEQATAPDLRPEEVPTPPRPIDGFEPIVGAERFAELRARAAETVERLGDHTFWNINSTARGGGVAEMLGPLVGYARGLGIDARWLAIQGEPAFFAVTKRIHNLLHGAPGDGGELGGAERAIYEDVLARNLDDLVALIRPGDIVLLHDPQTAGLVGPLRDLGATVVWRSHIGTDEPNELVAHAWAFLRPYVELAHATVFTRQTYVPDFLADAVVRLIPPSLDPFSAKNRHLEASTTRAIALTLGVVADGRTGHAPTFAGEDGSPRRIDRAADIVRSGPAPSPDAPLVVQVSRWDRLKDPIGVMHGFADHAVTRTDAHLALVGPSVAGVADDPEGAEVFNECLDAWQQLPSAARRRVQLVTLPMRDLEENAVMVNALQRHAVVVVQKSLREGFGLTVAEAMWKSRPVIGSATGGITDQILHAETGLLVPPMDLDAYGGALVELLDAPDRAAAMGKAAHERAAREFTGPRHLLQYAALVADLRADG